VCLSLTDFTPAQSHPVSGATQTEVGEGAVYEAAIIAEHAGAGAGAGVLLMSNLIELNG